MGLTQNQAKLLKWMLSDENYFSPYKFAMVAYPWGQGNLREFEGPRVWQKELMEDIEGYLRDGVGRKARGEGLGSFFRHAMSSGRGPGKSALLGMLAHWFMSTRIGGSTWVAANGEPQLRTKTFPEIAKWVAMGINSEFFDPNSMSIQPATWFRNYIESSEGMNRSAQYYYISGQLWSEEKPDAFAGAHNWDGEFAIFDEASGIPDEIWKVQNNVFTEDIVDRFWLCCSNPRKNSGAFFECFHKNRDLWRTKQLDARDVEGISHDSFEMTIKQYGVDSDEARVEVYGQFPNTGSRQFIELDRINEAMEREVEVDDGAPLLMGVDVARFGEDRSVISFRKGRDARSIPWQIYRKFDTQQLAREIARAADRHNPAAIFIDGGGVGGGVVDALKALRYKVIEVQAGSSPDDKNKYLNKRVEMWARLKEWLETGCIPNDKDLMEDLRTIQYSWHPVNGKLLLDSKESMKNQGLASPDCAESLIQTFSKPVARDTIRTSRGYVSERQRPMARDIDYDMFAA